MILDANAVLSSNQAITATAVSTGVYDTAGLGVGNPVTNTFGQTFGQATNFGDDIGAGGPNAEGVQLACIIGTAFTAAGAATLKVQLQCAVDTTNSGTPGTWDTIAETDTVGKAVLTAGANITPSWSVPGRYLGQNFPRFYRLNYVVATGPMTAGTIAFAGLLTGQDSLTIGSANY